MAIPSRQYVELETLNQQLSHIDKQISQTTQQLDYLSIAQNMLSELETASDEQEMLIPLGGGLFLPVKAKELSLIKTAVGAGVVIDKTPKDAKEFLVKKINELQELHDKLSQEYQVAAQKATALQEEMDKKI
ncbi:MAG: prefoldin subunit alpha [Candidatus Woesearchaeota archaeon]